MIGQYVRYCLRFPVGNKSYHFQFTCHSKMKRSVHCIKPNKLPGDIKQIVSYINSFDDGIICMSAYMY